MFGGTITSTEDGCVAPAPQIGVGGSDRTGCFRFTSVVGGDCDVGHPGATTVAETDIPAVPTLASVSERVLRAINLATLSP